MSTTTTDRWAKPADVSALDMAFGGRAMEIMPPREECEAALKALKDKGRKWRAIQFAWFFKGLSSNVKFYPVEGVDPEKAVNHLRCIQGSFEPKHEHKEAAVAYLLSRWFKDVRDYES